MRGLTSFLVGGLDVEDATVCLPRSPGITACDIFLWAGKAEVSRSKTQTFREQKQHIRNTFAPVPLDFLRKNVQHFPDCRSAQNAGACVEI